MTSGPSGPGTAQQDPPGDRAALRVEDPEAPAAPVAPAHPAYDGHLGELGAPLRRSPFVIGFFGGLGVFLAWWLGDLVVSIGPTLVLVVVSMFLAAGLDPAVRFFERRAGLRRSWAVVVVIVGVLAALTLFTVAIVPVISDQVASITRNAPGWLDSLQENQRVQEFDEKYGVIDKVREYVAGGDYAGGIFGGVLGVGLAVLSALANTFVVTVLTLYFLSSLQTTKTALYRLAPDSRRDRVTRLGDRIVEGVGGYVSGAFIVALCAGLTSLVFLFVIGLGEYAVALAFVVALLDVIPMIGATIGAVLVTAIGFATEPKIGIACAIFYLVYQQLENYVIYPRVMSRAVDVPGAVTVIAALVGAALLGVVGALLAIPTAAALLMLTREVVVRRQDAR
ncbi:AI-2E family transporter [Nocardioides marmotae]|uniref:AI-2E family transporter n=1 Tax=Nocardioides marmotae TaxID=2663857 RepID=UPI002934550A|nr:AI-2E family transporter [Nocardioides marmotae]